MGPDKLIAGYRRFRAETYPRYKALYDRLARAGQRPRAMVIACADSRVDPGTIVQAEPGDLFVTRSVANIVPPYAPGHDFHSTEAALEFAVRVLGVDSIVVMGHGQCGGIAALLDRADEAGDNEFIGPWIKLAAEARRTVLEGFPEAGRAELQKRLEEENIRLGLRRLLTYPWIRERVGSGALSLHGWHYAIATGVLAGYDRRTERFDSIV